MKLVEKKARATVQRLVREGHLHFCVPHAYDKMEELDLTEEDVESALMTATRCHLQENGRFNFPSTGRDGQRFVTIVEVEAAAIVVTVFA